MLVPIKDRFAMVRILIIQPTRIILLTSQFLPDNLQLFRESLTR